MTAVHTVVADGESNKQEPFWPLIAHAQLGGGGGLGGGEGGRAGGGEGVRGRRPQSSGASLVLISATNTPEQDWPALQSTDRANSSTGFLYPRQGILNSRSAPGMSG